MTAGNHRYIFCPLVLPRILLEVRKCFFKKKICSAIFEFFYNFKFFLYKFYNLLISAKKSSIQVEKTLRLNNVNQFAFYRKFTSRLLEGSITFCEKSSFFPQKKLFLYVLGTLNISAGCYGKLARKEAQQRRTFSVEDG